MARPSPKSATLSTVICWAKIPKPSAMAAADEALTAVAERLAAGGKVHLSYGEEDIEEYISQLVADHLIHGWDLAAATGQKRDLDPELVAEVAAWFRNREDIYRSSGAIAARPESASGGNPQADLLIAFGRNPDWARTSERSEQSDSGVGADSEQLVDGREAVTPIGQPIDQRADGRHALVSRTAARLTAVVEDQDRARACEPGSRIGQLGGRGLEDLQGMGEGSRHHLKSVLPQRCPAPTANGTATAGDRARASTPVIE